MRASKESIYNYYCCFLVLLNVTCIFAEWLIDDDGCTLPDGNFGYCINIYKCGPIINYVRGIQNLSPETSQHLSRFYCGVDGKAVKVCCPYEEIDFPRVEPENTTPPIVKTDNLNLLPSNCGYFPSENNIVGGSKTSIFDFPWMALLGYEEDKKIEFKCAGTIINDYYILTAAHCLRKTDNLVVVRLGEHNIDTERDCENVYPSRSICAPPVQDISVAEIISHPQFDENLKNNDIGLIRLASRINTSLDTVKPICLPLNDVSKNRDYLKENFIVAGWGVTEKLRRSSELLKVPLPIIPISNCVNAFKHLKINIDEATQFCVGGLLGKDSCNGDSGGPLQNIVGYNNGTIQFVQYGVVSIGPRLCGKGLPGIYTRVDHYTDWILSTLRP
ncbi:hypothetical protein FQR65_LT06393 [Abscondita terminalis]|nr:hypothetical protein FQR65_LT06393 [Abscondita terminalis]